jgi:hypothetical protein
MVSQQNKKKKVYKILSGTTGQSPMADALLTLAKSIFLSGCIPADWDTNIIVPIFKKGDETDTKNYRGVALKCTALKVICVMLNWRISNILERLKLLKPHQADFRRAEEAVAQATCLVELLQQRSAKKEETHALFVVMIKAYDMVPHEALFQKMEQHYGMHGVTMKFLRALYASSKCRVRLGVGASSIMSGVIECGRGLRQGCVLSPTFFSMFVNDIFNEVEDLPLGQGGVTVPGCAPDFTIPGLTFADDLVALGATRAAMARIAQCILRWMKWNEMDVNIAKCGLLHFGPNHEDFESAAANGALARGNGEDGTPLNNCFGYKGQLNPLRLIAEKREGVKA